MQGTREVRVWDPFVRTAHWILAAAVLIDLFVERPLWLHSWVGYLAVMVVVARVLWGFVGPEHARFASFVRGPRAVFGYLARLLRLSAPRYLGHSPAGGAMAVALLVMVAATSVSGMATLAVERGEGPLAGVISKVERPARVRGQRRPPLLIKQVHETLADMTMILVILHVVGVLLASVAHRENLVFAMITGRKRAD